MKIVTLSVSNFKRVRDVRITPDADRALVLIGGNNANGKSSVIDALTAALGGARALPADPVRHGADEAEIIIKLDGGLTIRRTITPSGETKLEVRDELGAVKAPQAQLDRIVNGRFLDPLSFLAMPAKDQRTQLMKLIPNADRIAELDGKRERCFTKRTEVGRDLTRAEGELERLVEVKVGTPIDVAELTAEAKKLAAMQRAGDGLGSALAQAETFALVERADYESTQQKIDKLERDLAQLRAELPKKLAAKEQRDNDVAVAKAKLAAASKEWAELQPRRDQIEADIARAGEHNRKVYADEASNKRRAEAAETVTKLTAEREELTKVLTTIDARKADILGAAKLPVDGLSIDEHGITLNGVPFVQSSRAEQLRVALGLACAASPELGDVWIRDGALLDDESLAMVEAHVKATGHRAWIERVGTKDPGVIVIQDGQVAP